ncbi:hypothetical protein ACQ0MK_20845 [Thalassospira lucentensis]|uniref:hypothetical protein n=1 Tax=Thalassospira lucentensis TaxID=168935 RepID=UPI003D2F280C
MGRSIHLVVWRSGFGFGLTSVGQMRANIYQTLFDAVIEFSRVGEGGLTPQIMPWLKLHWAANLRNRAQCGSVV